MPVHDVHHTSTPCRNAVRDPEESIATDMGISLSIAILTSRGRAIPWDPRDSRVHMGVYGRSSCRGEIVTWQKVQGVHAVTGLAVSDGELANGVAL